jgi:hypothetical protein
MHIMHGGAAHGRRRPRPRRIAIAAAAVLFCISFKAGISMGSPGSGGSMQGRRRGIRAHRSRSMQHAAACLE